MEGIRRAQRAEGDLSCGRRLRQVSGEGRRVPPQADEGSRLREVISAAGFRSHDSRMEKSETQAPGVRERIVEIAVAIFMFAVGAVIMIDNYHLGAGW